MIQFSAHHLGFSHGHLSAQRLPQAVYVFGPLTQLSICYSIQKLWPGYKNRLMTKWAKLKRNSATWEPVRVGLLDSLFMPVWRRPGLELRPRFLKVRVYKLLQLGHVCWIGKVLESRANDIYSKQEDKTMKPHPGCQESLQWPVLTGSRPQLHVNKVLVIAEQFGTLNPV